jgi:hypothetical protein
MASYEAADTIVGKVDYAPNGEWKNPRVLWVQYQNVKGSGLEQRASRWAGLPRRSATLSALGDKTAAVGSAIVATTGGL